MKSTDRQDCLHAARAYLAEAARRRHPANRDFYWMLLQWVANARRRAARLSLPQIDDEGNVT